MVEHTAFSLDHYKYKELDGSGREKRTLEVVIGYKRSVGHCNSVY